jgi:hypothetical protein
VERFNKDDRARHHRHGKIAPNIFLVQAQPDGRFAAEELRETAMARRAESYG